MGQSSVENYEPTNFFWEIKDLSLFINSLCEQKLEVEILPQMVPIYSVKSDPVTINFIQNKIKQLTTNFDFYINSKTNTTIAFFFRADNQNEIFFKKKIDKSCLEIKGLRKKIVDENTGVSAYHHPEGILYRYGRNLVPINKDLLDINGCSQQTN